MLARLTSRARLISTGLAVSLVAALLLTWTLQRGAEPVQAASAGGPVRVEPASTEEPLPEPRRTFAAAAPMPAPSPTPKPEPTPTPTVKPEPKSSAAPAVSGFRIRIPSIGLERLMEGRGVSANGTIDPPRGTVMWFTGYDRVRPGQVGTAVIAGHVASGGRPDVFADLAEVDVGDTVRVSEDGRTITYRVTRASAIDKYEVTTDEAVWGANTSRSRLAIITCDDAFGFRSDGHRKANFVVIAERR